MVRIHAGQPFSFGGFPIFPEDFSHFQISPLAEVAAWERAQRGGYSLPSACEAFERSRTDESVVKTDVKSAGYGFIESKKQQNLKPFTLELMESSLLKLAGQFQEVRLAEIRVDQVERYLDQRGGSPKSRRNWITEAHEFFDWGLARRYVCENPVRGGKKPIVTCETPKVLTPEQAEALLIKVRESEPDLLAFTALCPFTGVRTGEAKRLTWKAVDVARSIVTVGADIAKTRRRRTIQMPANLKAWLKLGGKLPLDRIDYELATARKAAGISDWPRNVMRHLFCSYHLALHENAAQTALATGHTETMLFTHYRELVTKEDAEKFFSIYPSNN